MAAFIVFGLVFNVSFGGGLVRAQEPQQAVPAAAALALPDASSSVSGSPAGAVDESSTPATAVPEGQEACWKQAGLTKDVVEQRKSIVSGAKAQIRSIESDTTLSPAQQKQQIRQIRVNARQQAGKLVTPEQQEALRRCRQERIEARQNSTAGSTPDDSGNNAYGTSPAPNNSTGPTQPK
jgi:hypothetical protein